MCVCVSQLKALPVGLNTQRDSDLFYTTMPESLWY